MFSSVTASRIDHLIRMQMIRFKQFLQSLRIILKSIGWNLALFALLLAAVVLIFQATNAFPDATWLDLLVNAFHMVILERVTDGAQGITPALATFLLPILSIFILGEGALRVLSIFIQRGEHRKEWDEIMAKSFHGHVVICGAGEMGKAVVRRLLTVHPQEKIVLLELKPDILPELGLSGSQFAHLQGDMTDIEMLKKANCPQARMIIVTSGDDSHNLETAVKINSLCQDTPIWVRLHHAGLADLLEVSKKANIHFFSPYQQAAESLVKQLLH